MAHVSIKDKIALAKQTGKVHRHIINPAEIGSTNPLVGFLPKTQTVLKITPIVPVLVGDLIEICKANPDHELSVQKRMSVFGLPDDRIVHVLQQDLDSLSDTPKKAEEERLAAEAEAKRLADEEAARKAEQEQKEPTKKKTPKTDTSGGAEKTHISKGAEPDIQS